MNGERIFQTRTVRFCGSACQCCVKAEATSLRPSAVTARPRSLWEANAANISVNLNVMCYELASCSFPRDAFRCCSVFLREILLKVAVNDNSVFKCGSLLASSQLVSWLAC